MQLFLKMQLVAKESIVFLAASQQDLVVFLEIGRDQTLSLDLFLEDADALVVDGILSQIGVLLRGRGDCGRHLFAW